MTTPAFLRLPYEPKSIICLHLHTVKERVILFMVYKAITGMLGITVQDFYPVPSSNARGSQWIRMPRAKGVLD